MFISNNKKQIQWTKKDYVVTILNFVMHYLILSALVVGSIMLFSGNETTSMIDGFVQYFRDNISLSNRNVNMLIYTLITCAVIVVSIYLFFYHEMHDYLVKPKNILLIFAVIEFSLIVTVITSKYIHIYARPMAMCALLILTLINKKSAFFLHFCFCLIQFSVDVLICDLTGSTLLREAPMYLSLVIGCVSGVFGIYLVDGVGSRIKVFVQGFVISVPVIITILVIQFDTSMKFVDLIKYISYGLVAGVTSAVYMMAVVPIFESLFNIVTSYRLAELTDHKSKLIMRLRNEAPGTFNHCLVVSSIAESCATAIGENALLARAASYYHDMGKLRQPNFFTENQHGVNPHDELTPELSTEIIRSHTKDGYDFIRKHHLPQILADVAREHHGTLPIQYFYIKAKKFTDGEVNIADFSYPGPKPQTNIAAIIMLADGCEAAVRALDKRSHDNVENVVRRIIEDRMNNDQFADCDLTMKDIEIIRNTIVDSLTGVYHDRINYPKLKIGHNSSFGSSQSSPEPSSTATNKKTTSRKGE